MFFVAFVLYVAMGSLIQAQQAYADDSVPTHQAAPLMSLLHDGDAPSTCEEHRAQTQQSVASLPCPTDRCITINPEQHPFDEQTSHSVPDQEMTAPAPVPLLAVLLDTCAGENVQGPLAHLPPVGTTVLRL